MLSQRIIPPPPIKSGSNLVPASNTSFVNNCNSATRLKRRVWKALFFYINSHGSLSNRSQVALLRGILHQGKDRNIEREKILSGSNTGDKWGQAEQILIEACNELIADLSEDLGGAA